MDEFEYKIYKLIKSLPDNERQKLCNRISSIQLATKINRSEDFFNETLDVIEKEYPVIAEYLKHKIQDMSARGH